MSSIPPNKSNNNNNNNNVPPVKSTNDDKADENLMCPISFKLMKRAILITCCGQSFDDDALQAWFKKKNVCPMCNSEEFKTSPNRNLQDTINKVVAANNLLALKAPSQEAKIKQQEIDSIKKSLCDQFSTLRAIYIEASDKGTALEVLFETCDELQKYILTVRN